MAGLWPCCPVASSRCSPSGWPWPDSLPWYSSTSCPWGWHRSSSTALRGPSAAADRGAGVLLVEQHVHKAMEILDRVYVIDRGRISLAGDAADLRSRIDEIQTSSLAGPERPERNGHQPPNLESSNGTRVP